MKTSNWRVYGPEDYKPEYRVENSGRSLLVRNMLVRNLNGRANAENGDEPGRVGWAVWSGHSGAIYREVSEAITEEIHRAQKQSTSFDDFIQKMEKSILSERK
jgi:hypothetical protein